MTYPIPLEALDDRLAIVGTLGLVEYPSPGMVKVADWAREVLQ